MRAAHLLFALLLLASCRETKKISGRYSIERFSEGKENYYVIERGHYDAPGGVFDGIVTRLAVDEETLYADVQRLASIDPSGWYSLNLRTGEMKGPLKESSIPVGGLLSAAEFHRTR